MTYTGFKHRNGFCGELSPEWEKELKEKYLQYLNSTANKVGNENNQNKPLDKQTNNIIQYNQTKQNLKGGRKNDHQQLQIPTNQKINQSGRKQIPHKWQDRHSSTIQ